MRILIVDDNALFRKACVRLIETVCEEHGETVSITQAKDGKQALGLLAVLGRFDTVLTDWQMPRLDGISLLRQIEAEYPDMRRVLMSGNDIADEPQEAFGSGLAQALWDKLDRTAIPGCLELPEEEPEEPQEDPPGLQEIDGVPEVPEDGETAPGSPPGCVSAPAVEPVDGRLTRTHISDHAIVVVLDFMEHTDWGAHLHCYTGIAKDRKPTKREEKWILDTVADIRSRLEKRRGK